VGAQRINVVWGPALPEQLPDLPDVGVFVTLEDEDGGEHRSQVQALDPPRLTLIRPDALAAGSALLVGAEVILVWASGSVAVNKTHSRIATMRNANGARLLDLEVQGPSWREERRHWVRVAVNGPVEIGEVADRTRSVAPRTATGELLDLSEVAVRCAVDANAIWACRRNARVRAAFALDGDGIELNSRVIASKVSTQDAARREIVLRFDDPSPVLDLLRSYVLARQQATRPGQAP
jgi:hypothetical protein